ncbi:hypothetical protein LTS08_001679 [Lithohypha guttulata]|uniref:uncharacterized protein n=1 Tax=Lithohypha guttulata TaxID=1690604 RepID=UPI002DE00A8E|nr:hypothetical protein LTR51_003638 [Lithohypha guttulata]KAK5105402.1 hypothetical protein LTS08_001679 [Lithohypha guttulata]
MTINGWQYLKTSINTKTDSTKAIDHSLLQQLFTSTDMGRLTDVFQDKTRNDQSSSWTQLWNSNEESLWDRGQPSPALVDFLEQHSAYIPSLHSQRRPRALIPACGRGYDVVTFALHGFDAYGLEVAQTAVNAGEEYARSQMGADAEGGDSRHFGKRGKKKAQADGVVGQTKFVLGDFFATDWEEGCGGSGKGFDVVYDYTFLCALLPEMRADWARRMSELLAPDGILVCLEFPLYKDPAAQGPPYGMKGVYWDLLSKGGDGIDGQKHSQSHGEADEVRSVPSDATWERILYYKPERTFKVGEGTDMLSVWRKMAS